MEYNKLKKMIKSKLLVIGIYIFSNAIALNGQQMKPEKLNSFWNTIQKMESIIYEMETSERLDFLYESVSEINEGLYVEMSAEKLENEKYHVIISANGNKELFGLIRKICSKKPDLKFLEVTGFRQANESYKGINYEGLNLSVEEMYFNPVLLKEGLGMEFYVPKQGEEITNDIIHNYGSIVIDNLIGEVQFSETIIGFDFYELTNNEIKSNLKPLNELAEFITEYKKNK